MFKIVGMGLFTIDVNWLWEEGGLEKDWQNLTQHWGGKVGSGEVEVNRMKKIRDVKNIRKHWKVS